MNEQRIKIVTDKSADALAKKVELVSGKLLMDMEESVRKSGVLGGRFYIDSLRAEYHFAQTDKEYSCMIVGRLEYKETKKWLSRKNSMA